MYYRNKLTRIIVLFIIVLLAQNESSAEQLLSFSSIDSGKTKQTIVKYEYTSALIPSSYSARIVSTERLEGVFNKISQHIVMSNDKGGYTYSGQNLGACTVNTTADTGPGSLRDCLQNVAAGATIHFDPLIFPPNTPATIMVLSPLPAITIDNLTIDGSSAGVILDGSNTISTTVGLMLESANSVIIQGLHITNFPTAGILLTNGTTNSIIGGTSAEARNIISGSSAGVGLTNIGTDNNQILGNYIGTDASGTIEVENMVGIAIFFGAKNNIIGGTQLGARNILSGNTEIGVAIGYPGTENNKVQGNYIGVDATGINDLGNGLAGVAISKGAQNNLIGGASPQMRNIISGNAINNINCVPLIPCGGVFIHEAGTTGNQVQGNYIGTDKTGSIGIGNEWGILITGGAKNNIIGGETSGAGNVISGNNIGIQLEGRDTSNNEIKGNFIGTDAGGTQALANNSGIAIINNAHNNTIGGKQPGARNIISGNVEAGVFIECDDIYQPNQDCQDPSGGSRENRVEGNYIGTDKTGEQPLGNQWGVGISGHADGNIINNNLISGNTESGIQLRGVTFLSIPFLYPTNSIITGNIIGLDHDGSSQIEGNQVGILLVDGASENIIGGSSNVERNIISGHTSHNPPCPKNDCQVGILIKGDYTWGNDVIGNNIGTNLSGTLAVGNRWGIVIEEGAYDNSIENNLIGGNDVGIQIEEPNTRGNIVRDNVIGSDEEGKLPLGNLNYGLGVIDQASVNIIGPGNHVYHNQGSGVYIENASGNTITQNSIYHNYGRPIEVHPSPFHTPALQDYVDDTLIGQTCANCTVEIFINPSPPSGGLTFQGTVNADAQGVFSFPMTLTSESAWVSATSTHGNGTTSEFSPGLCIQEPGLSLCGLSLFLPMIVK